MYFNERCPNYLNEVFDVATESSFLLRVSFQKSKIPIENSFLLRASFQNSKRSLCKIKNG